MIIRKVFSYTIPGGMTMEKNLERIYQEKISRLEEDISGLRMSRRVMMSLLEQDRFWQKAETQRLVQENKRLNKRLASYAKRLWQSRTDNC